MLNRIKLLFWKTQKLIKLKKIKLQFPQTNRKIINMTHQLPPQKNDTVDEVYKSREMFIKEANASITSTKNI